MAEQIGLQAVLDMSQFTGNVSKYLASVQKMEGETASMAGKVAGHFQSFGKVALAATAGIAGAGAAAAAGLAKFTIDGIKQAANLEAQLSSIGAVLGATKEQLGPLNDLIMNLGLDPTLVVTAQEAANVIEELAKQGMSMSQIMDGAAKSTILLANATGGDFTDSATVMTDAMSLFGITAADSMEAVNGITGVVNASKYSLNDYALALGAGGAVASQAGISFTDFNTTIAATSSSFTSASDAGTSLKTFIQRLTPQSKEARGAIEELGLSFYNADGTMKSMAEIGSELNRVFQEEVTTTQQVSGLTQEQANRKKYLEQTIQSLNTKLADYQSGLAGVAQSEADKAVSVDRLNRQLVAAQNEYATLTGVQGGVVTSTRKLTDEEKTYYMGLIFGTDAMRMAYAMMETGEIAYTDAAVAARELGVSIDEVNKVAEGGITKFEAFQLQIAKIDAQEQAKQRMDNLKGALQILGGQFETIQLMIGQKFLPILTNMVQLFSEFVSQHSPAVIAAFDAFAVALGTFFNALTSGQGFLDAFFFAMATFGPTGVLIATTVENIVAGIQGFISVVSAALEPITTFISGFVTWQDVLIVTGGAIASVVVPAIISLIAAIAPVIAVVAAATLAVAALRTAWETNFLGIQTIVTSAVAAIRAQWEPFVATLSTLASGVISFISDHFYELGAALAAVGVVLAGVQFAAWWGSITAAVTAAWPVITAALAAINLPLVALGATMALLAAAWAGNWFDIQGKTQVAINYILTALQPFTSAVSQHMQGALSEIKAFVTGNQTEFTNVKAIWEGAKTSGMTLFNDLKTYVTSNLPTWIATLSQWGSAAWQWISTAVTVVAGEINKWWTSISSAVTSKYGSWTGLFTTWGISAWNWIVLAAGQVASKVSAWWTVLSTSITGKYGGWTGLFTTWGIAAWNWIVTAAGQVASKIAAWYTVLSSSVTSRYGTWTNAFATWGIAAWNWIVTATGQIASKIAAWYTTLASSVSSRFGTWSNVFTTWGIAAWNWIVLAAGQVISKVAAWYTNLSSAVTSRYGSWTNAFISWTTAAWQWIITAAGQVSTKIGTWWTNINTRLSTLRTTFGNLMLTWATHLVDWIGSKAANALPELGKWLGKITAWTVIGAGILIGAVVKFGAALLSWVATAITDVPTKLDEWLTAISTWVTGTGLSAFQGYVAGFATAFWSWITTSDADLVGKFQTLLGAIGRNITLIGTGLAGFASGFGQTFIDTLTGASVAEGGGTLNYGGIGQSIIDAIVNGWPVLTTYLSKFTDMVTQGVAALASESSWKTVGTNIIDGVKKGLDEAKDKFFEKIKKLAEEALGKIAEALGIGSPSKEFAIIGGYIVDGLVVGVDRQAPALMRAMTYMANATYKSFAGAIGAHSPATAFIPAGEAIVEGVVAGIENGQGELTNTVVSMAKNIDDTFTSAIKPVIEGFSSFVDKGLNDLKDALSSFGSMFGTISKYTNDLFGEDSNKAIKERMDAQQDLLSVQAELMDMVEKLGINPQTALPFILGLDVNKGDLQNQIKKIWDMLLVESEKALQQRQKDIGLKFAIQEITKLLAVQDEAFSAVAEFEFTTIRSAAQAEPLAKRWGEINQLITTAVATETDASKLNATLNSLYSERATIMQQLNALQSDQLAGIDKYTKGAELAAIQLELITKAMEIGAAIPDAAFGDILTDPATLEAIKHLERVASADALGQLQKSISDLQLKPVYDAIAAQDALIEKMSGGEYSYATKSLIDTLVQNYHSFDNYIKSISESNADVAYKEAMINGYLEHRATILDQIRTTIERTPNTANSDVIAMQLELIREAQALNIAIPAEAWNSTSVNFLYAVQSLESAIATAKEANLQKELNNLFSLQGTPFDSMNVDKQMALIQQAKEAGAWIAPAAFGNLADPQTIMALADLYQRTLSQQAVNAQNQLAQMMVQQMTQVTEAQNAAFAQLEANQAKTLAGAGAMQTISTAWENLTVQINAVVNEMAQLSVAQLNSAQGIDLQQQLNNLLAQRAILYQQLADAQRLEVDYGVAESKQRTEFVQKQMAITQEAKDLGIALPDAIFGAMSDPATLAALSAVEGAIARTKAAAEQAKLDTSRLFKDLPFNSMDVQQQIQLIQKAIDMGIQIPKAAFGSLADPITMQSLAGLYNQIQVVNQEVFGQTLKALEAQYQASSLLGDLYDADIQATGIGSGLINTYKTQMLDPMMKAINDASTSEAERLRLIEEYKANMEKIVQLQKAQSQLDFLKMQQDIISQLDSGSGHLSNMDLQGLINEIRANIDAGFQFGSGASWEGLLHFASRGTELLLKTFAAKMGINSPSTVMMDYGRYVVEGFAIGMKDLTERPLAVMEEMLVPIREKLSGFVNGINSLAVQPVSASPRLMPLPASMSPSVMTMNMGGVTINNGMDEAMFAARVRQVVEGMLN